MPNNFTKKTALTQNIFNLLGKIIGALAAIFWGATLLVQAISAEKDLSLAKFLLTTLMVLNITGVIISWKNARSGSLTIIISGLILIIFTWLTIGLNEALSIFILTFPFLIAGILFLIGLKKPKGK